MYQTIAIIFYIQNVHLVGHSLEIHGLGLVLESSGLGFEIHGVGVGLVLGLVIVCCCLALKLLPKSITIFSVPTGRLLCKCSDRDHSPYWISCTLTISLNVVIGTASPTGVHRSSQS